MLCLKKGDTVFQHKNQSVNVRKPTNIPELKLFCMEEWTKIQILKAMVHIFFAIYKYVILDHFLQYIIVNKVKSIIFFSKLFNLVLLFCFLESDDVLGYIYAEI